MVPKIIHQMWIDPINEGSTELPRDVEAYTDQWKLKHPEFKHKIWGVSDFVELCDSLGRQDVKYAFLESRFPSMKADIARLMLLEQFGGIWADLRLRPLVSVPNELLSENDIIVVEHFASDDLPHPNGLLNNTFIAAIPRHPVVVNALRLAVENVLRRNGTNVFRITGPANLMTSKKSFVLEHPEKCSAIHMLGHNESWGVLWEYCSSSYNSNSRHWSLRQKSESPFLDVSPERKICSSEMSSRYLAIPGHAARIDDIFSKVGFYETTGQPNLAWVSRAPQISFRPLIPFDGIRLRIYSNIQGYPLLDVQFIVNGQQVRSEARAANQGWSFVEVGPFRTKSDENTLDVSAPYLSFAISWFEPYLR